MKRERETKKVVAEGCQAPPTHKKHSPTHPSSLLINSLHPSRYFTTHSAFIPVFTPPVQPWRKIGICKIFPRALKRLKVVVLGRRGQPFSSPMPHLFLTVRATSNYFRRDSANSPACYDASLSSYTWPRSSRVHFNLEADQEATYKPVPIPSLDQACFFI